MDLRKISRLLFAQLVFVLFIMSTLNSCGQSAAHQQAPDSNRMMLHPDENTQYLDESGKKIDAKQFASQIQTGKYSFAPEMENGRVKTLKLTKAEQKLSLGQPFPEFSLTDINGRQFDLKELRGKIVIVNFWFVGCTACVREMPDMNDLRDKYKDNLNVVFLAVTYDPASTVKTFLSKRDFKFNIIAGQQDLINQCGISSFPTSIVIDKNGGIAFMLTSYTDTNVPQLEGVIAALK